MPTAGQIAYRSFLKSDFWLSLAAEKKRQVGKCEECGSTTHLQAHHIEYPANWYETTLDQLQVLCRRHHKLAHGLREASRFFAFRDDDRFNRLVHWCAYLRQRICGRSVRLKPSERRYLTAALKTLPDATTGKAAGFQVGLVLSADEFMGIHA